MLVLMYACVQLRGDIEDINKMPMLTYMEFISMVLDFWNKSMVYSLNNMEGICRARERLKTFKGV